VTSGGHMRVSLIIRALTPAIGVVLIAAISLAGYGVAIAIENVFDIPRGLAYDSAINLWHLSSYAAVGAIDFFSSQTFFTKLVEGSVRIFIVSFLVSLICFLFSKFKDRFGPGIRSRFARKKFVRFACDLFASMKGKKAYFLLPLLVSGSPLVCVAALFCVLLAIFTVPLAAAEAAEYHFNRWAVAAEFCSPMSSREQRIQRTAPRVEADATPQKRIRVSSCLEAWHDGELIAKGRHVTSTSGHVILFDAETGHVRRVALDGVSLNVVGMDEAVLLKVVAPPKD